MIRIGTFLISVLLLVVSSPSCHGYHVLVAFPASFPLDRPNYLRMAEVLADAGHQVTTISSGGLGFDHPNISEIPINVSNYTPDMYGKEYLRTVAREMWSNPSIQRLFNDRDTVDALIIPILHNEFCHPFLVDNDHTVLVTFSPTGREFVQMTHYSGNWVHPAMVSYKTSSVSFNMGFWKRIESGLKYLWSTIVYYHFAVPDMEEFNKDYSPKRITSKKLIESHKLMLINTHHSIYRPLPLLPSQVEIGGFHITSRTNKKEASLGSLSLESSPGTIFVSLEPEYWIPEENINDKLLMLEAFKLLNYTVLWHYEGHFYPGVIPHNVKVMPNVDREAILRHPSTVLFISNCDANSVHEALFFGVPLLALPRTPLQTLNARLLKSKNLTAAVPPYPLDNSDHLRALVEGTLNDKNYRARMLTAQKQFGGHRASLLVQSVEDAIEHK